MGFMARVGDAWSVLTGAIEIKYVDEKAKTEETIASIIPDDPKTSESEEALSLVSVPEVKPIVITIDVTERKFDLTKVAGNIPLWIEENVYPKNATYSIDGEVVTINGTLPLKEIT